MMTIQLFWFGFILGCCFGGMTMWYIFRPTLRLAQEMAPWIEIKKLQDQQDAWLASLKPEDQSQILLRKNNPDMYDHRYDNVGKGAK